MCALRSRLAQGEDNLAALAADLGFSHHAHIARSVRWETRQTPSASENVGAPSWSPATP